MKASELMINDWVWSDILQRPCQVGRPSDFRFMYTKRYDVFDENGEFKHITPIPLTEKMLLANGFVYDSHGFTYWADEDGVEPPFHVLQSNRYGLRIDIPYRVISLQYVHQLQHALRLCGLNDLADNFKIE